MTERKRENPLKAQSQEWLAEALMDLMKEKPFQQINITQITEHALLARRTFYRHFKVKEDVLNYIVQKLCDQCVSMLLEHTNSDFKTIALVYFTFWESHKEFLFTMENNDLLFLLLQKYNQYLPEMWSKTKGTSDNPLVKEYGLYFSSGGFWNLLLKWLQDGAYVPPYKMATLADEIRKHFI